MNLKSITTIGLAALAGAGAVAGAAGRDAAEPAHGHPQVSTMQATYPVYADLRAITRDSTAVVRATVTGQRRARWVVPAGVDPARLPAFKRRQLGFLVTDTVVRVHDVISGPQGLRGRDIELVQLGGTAGDQRFVAEDEPPARAGEEQVLFLRRGPDGRFRTVGGAQGRFLVRGGRLQPIAQSETPVVRQLSGAAVRTVTRGFSRLLRSDPPAQARVARERPERLRDVPDVDKPAGTDGVPPRP